MVREVSSKKPKAAPAGSPDKSADNVVFGIQVVSAELDGPKKILIAEEGKKIWRDERLVSARSKRVYCKDLRRKLPGWIRRMADNDLPSIPDSEEEESQLGMPESDSESEEESLDGLRQLHRETGKILVSPPKAKSRLAKRTRANHRSPSPQKTRTTKDKYSPGRFSPDPFELDVRPRSPSKSPVKQSPARRTPAKLDIHTPVDSPAISTGRPSSIFATVRNLFTRRPKIEESNMLPLSIVDAGEDSSDSLPSQAQALADWQTQAF